MNVLTFGVSKTIIYKKLLYKPVVWLNGQFIYTICGHYPTEKGAFTQAYKLAKQESKYYENSVVVSAYDKPDTIDRFTICFEGKDFDSSVNKGMVYMVGSSSNPFHPQGFWQHTEGRMGSHLGKRVMIKSLPEDVQRAIKQELE